MNKVKQGFYTIFYMLAATVIFITFVSSVFLLTRNLIKSNESLYIKKAVLYTAGLYLDHLKTKVIDTQSIEKYYNENITEINQALYAVISQGSIDDFNDDLTITNTLIFKTRGAGLWGEIIALIGINPADNSITGIDFIKQNETPGLGARISEDWFREQFRGKTGPFTMVNEGGQDNTNQFDAITGATITSTAVQTLLNNTYKQINK